ncbi:MAG TPA: apolipoprotein N-acyltransferase [Daejeonella sp.]|nr:apolipoprotein N-acyltransferase [Daejeonella sp.]
MKRNIRLAIASAFLLWLAWPPIPFTGPILLIALLPLLLVVDNILESEQGRKGRQVFRLSLLTFFIWNTASIYWVFNSLHSVMPGWLAVLISLIPFGLAALLMALAFWLYYRFRRHFTRFWSYAALICFWIGYEYLHQSWDLAFPWMTLGNGFAQTHYLVQWYEFTGVYGGTLWILLSNIFVYETYRAYQAGSAIKKSMLLRSLTLILAPILISLSMYFRYQEKENPANVVVVQPNIDPYAKFGSMPVAEQLNKLIRLSDSLGQTNTEYFIWPETAIPEAIEEENIRANPNFQIIENFLSKYKNGNLISGIESYSVYDSAQTPTARFDGRINKHFDVFNAAVQIENSPKVQFYHKSKLVPGVEQIPFAQTLAFLKPVFAGFGGSTGSYGKQLEPSVFYSQSGIGAAPVICYESIWGEYVADYVKKGAQFIAVITNDGWWGNTSGKDQHLQYAKLRAIETRRWVARSANTGISAFINQRGDIVKQSSWWVPTALKADINLNEEITFYAQHGDYIALAGCLGSALFGIMLLARAWRRKK